MQEDKKIEEYVTESDFDLKDNRDWRFKLVRFLESKYFLAVVIVLLVVISFSLGRISGLQDKRLPVRVISSQNSGEVKGASVTEISIQNNASTPDFSSVEQVVASKNGTKYHYPWCAGAKQIAEKNKVTFNTIEEARAKGYTPASNCKGLK